MSIRMGRALSAAPAMVAMAVTASGSDRGPDVVTGSGAIAAALMLVLAAVRRRRCHGWRS